MKLAHLKNTLKADLQAVAAFHKVKPLTVAHMWQLLAQVSSDRSYDNDHPRYEQATRVLPYDGRVFCFYYCGGANDTHVETLLKCILKNWEGAGV